MEHGRVIERGTHQALIAANGAYAQMWQMQKREEGEG
jgi:ATP-binding cassette subfamily B protein